MLSKELLEILCCPGCHGDLLYEPQKETLTCRKCRAVYPVKDDIPIMIIDDEEKASGAK